MLISINDLKFYEKNAKDHPKAQVDKIKKSIQKFGFRGGIKVTEDLTIITGHGRVLALKELGYKDVEVEIIKDLKPEDIKAYRIADNKTAESNWIDDLLKQDFAELQLLNYDLSFTGFNENEIEKIIGYEENEKDDLVPKNPPSIAKLGDIWQLGEHRIMCGDCTKKEDVDLLLNGITANVLITDPPYGINYSDKNNSMASFRPNKNIHNDIKNDITGELKDFFTKFLLNLKGKFDNTFYIFMSGQELHNLRAAIVDCNYKWGDYLIWKKNKFVLGRKDYNAQHEFIVYGWQDRHKFFGQNNSSTIIEFNRPQSSKLHPTMKPVELIEKLIKDSTLANNIVLDVFLGSGSTLIACEKLNRVCYGMELEPHYIDVIIKRWEDYTGNKAKKI